MLNRYKMYSYTEWMYWTRDDGFCDIINYIYVCKLARD